jgi:hypothetical protein
MTITVLYVSVLVIERQGRYRPCDVRAVLATPLAGPEAGVAENSHHRGAAITACNVLTQSEGVLALVDGPVTPSVELGNHHIRKIANEARAEGPHQAILATASFLESADLLKIAI